MKVYHGTAWKLAEKIRNEDRLNPRPGNEYVYVTSDIEKAKMYAEAWTAAFIRDVAPIMGIKNPAPDGAILSIEVADEFLLDDPYNPEGEPDQYRVKGSIYTDDMTFEKVNFPKLNEESALLRAYSFWIGIANAVDESVSQKWLQLLESKKRKIKKFEEFTKSLTSSYTPPEHVIEPAKDDKGYAFVKKAFDKMEKYYQPSIRK